MDLDIFTPDYKKEQKALEKVQELLSRASKALSRKRPESPGLYLETLSFLDSKRELFVQHKDEFSDCYIEIATALADLGRSDDSLRALEAALQVAPGNASAWAEIGKAVQAQGRFEDAVGFLDRALVLAPDDAETWVAKGNVMRALMEYGEARLCYGKALQLEPLRIDFYELLHEISPEDPEVLRGKGVALSLRGRHAEAAEELKEALELSPEDPATLTEMGKALDRAGKPDEALALFDRALQSHPGFKGAHVARARVHAGARRYEEALKAYDAALRIDPVDREALTGASEVLVSLGRHREALEFIGRTLELAPRDADLLTRKGAALEQAGDLAGAARSYEEAITISPAEGRAWAGKGRSLLRMGRSGESLQYLAKAVELEPGNPAYSHRQGLALAAEGRLEEAVNSFNVALEHDQDHLEAVLGRGDALLALGRMDDAIRAFTRASVLAPGSPAAWLGRARCSLREDRYDEALAHLDRVLAIDAGNRPAREMRALVTSLREKSELEGCARRVLDFEQRNDRMPSREEAFRDCQVPFEKLERVMGHIGDIEPVDLRAMSVSEKSELDDRASDLIRKVPPGKPLRLSDAVKAPPGATVIQGKRVLGYIEAVRGEALHIESPLDPRTEERSRAGLHLAEEERDLFGLVRRLNLPLGEARRVEEVLKAIKSGRPPPAPPVVEDTPAAEVPESELESTPDLHVEEKRPRRPRKRPSPEVPVPAAETPPAAQVPVKRPGPAASGPEDEGMPAAEEGEARPREEAGESKPAAEERPARRPRRPRARPAPDGGAAPEDRAAPGEGTGGEEALDDAGIQDISESIKDIVTSIEKREKRAGTEEGLHDRGRRGRTYCSVCHSIIATIHHGCGAHLCSRCVIDFNKDRRAERNLCPKCLKPIETSPPPAGARGGWRDTL